MSIHHPAASGVPPTLGQYRAMQLQRPLTDKPVGATTASRRTNDANNSAIHTHPDKPDFTQPPTKPIDFTHAGGSNPHDYAARNLILARQARAARRARTAALLAESRSQARNDRSGTNTTPTHAEDHARAH